MTRLLGTCLGALLPVCAVEPLVIATSAWPGWDAWQIGVERGYFAEAGVEVRFISMDYLASLDAFAAGKAQAVCGTNADLVTLVIKAPKARAVLINDYSNGNDMVIAMLGIADAGALGGKKVAVETGVVSHFLLLKALDKAGLTDSDVTIVNTPTDKLPGALGKNGVVAIATWQPVCNEVLAAVPGAKPIFTSAEAPGLIYDLLIVDEDSLKTRADDWRKVTGVWQRIVATMEDPTQADAVLKTMAKASGMEPTPYHNLLAGTKLLGLEENRKRLKDGTDLNTLGGSCAQIVHFYLGQGILEKSIFAQALFTAELLAKP